MDSTTYSIKSNNSSTDNNETNNVSAKLRRLKIQEGLLLQNIKKDIVNNCTEENNFFESCLEFKKFINHINTSYTTIKTLLNDVKTATQSEEILRSLDLNDIKRDILELDEKLIAFKMFLHSEHSLLKQQEQDTMKKIIENTLDKHKIKVIKGVTAKSYSDIVPSPVKNIINSPLKCQEVQNLQDFLSVTTKYGGWNEYYHNIFVKLWSKHVKDGFESLDSTSLDSPTFNRLTDDFLSKAQSFRRSEVISHIKWYTTYLHLKSCQQRALEEWRAKTKPLKNSSHIEDKQIKHNRKNSSRNSRKQKLSEDSHRHGRFKTAAKPFLNESRAGSSKAREQQFYDCLNANEYLKEINNSLDATGILNKRELSFGFGKPTKQWNIKCNSLKDPQMQEHGIEHITKLGIPSWRLGLLE